MIAARLILSQGSAIGEVVEALLYLWALSDFKTMPTTCPWSRGFFSSLNRSGSGRRGVPRALPLASIAKKRSAGEVVGASGFEPPTSWSRTIARRGIKHLAGLRSVAPGCAQLPTVQTLTALPARSVRNGAQQREAQGGHKSGHSGVGRVMTACPRTYPRPGTDFAPVGQARVPLL
jgi:hypothetical protein